MKVYTFINYMDAAMDDEPIGIACFDHSVAQKCGKPYLCIDGKWDSEGWWTPNQITQAEFETYAVMEVFPVLEVRYPIWGRIGYRLRCVKSWCMSNSGTIKFYSTTALTMLIMSLVTYAWTLTT